MKAGNRSKSKGSGGYVEDCFSTTCAARKLRLALSPIDGTAEGCKINSLTKRTVGTTALLGLIACSYAVAAGHYS